MATNSISSPYEKLFDATDTNGDGSVEWADYQRLIDRIVKTYNLDKNDRRTMALTASYQMTWMEMLRHANGNDRLSKEQFISALHSSMVDTSRFNMADGLPHALFDIIDTDSNNELNKDEFVRFATKAVGGTEPRALEAFTQLDLDGDGVISRQEMIRGFREFLFGEDPQSWAGGLVLGVL